VAKVDGVMDDDCDSSSTAIAAGNLPASGDDGVVGVRWWGMENRVPPGLGDCCDKSVG